MSEWTLWGVSDLYANGTPIKLAGGSLPHVRQCKATRTQDGTWTTLVVAPQGKRPWFPGDDS